MLRLHLQKAPCGCPHSLLSKAVTRIESQIPSKFAQNALYAILSLSIVNLYPYFYHRSTSRLSPFTAKADISHTVICFPSVDRKKVSGWFFTPSFRYNQLRITPILRNKMLLSVVVFAKHMLGLP